MTMNLSVSELSASGVPLISGYWANSSPEHLLGMGADPAKIPPRDLFEAMLLKQIGLPYEEKQALALLWHLDGQPVGHCNVNGIAYGEQAFFHLHLWQPGNRQKGVGTAAVRMALPIFFERLQLKRLFCEPYALNPSPNKTLSKVGFRFTGSRVCIPGPISFEQEVNRWEITREDLTSG